LEEEINMPVYVADDPLTCVVRGTGIILEKLDQFKDIKDYKKFAEETLKEIREMRYGNE